MLSAGPELVSYGQSNCATVHMFCVHALMYSHDACTCAGMRVLEALDFVCDVAHAELRVWRALKL